MGAPGEEGGVLVWCGTAVTEVAVGQDRHDFREWAGTLDAFTRYYMNEELLTGHEQAQERTANPALNWLRAVGLLVLKCGKAGQARLRLSRFGDRSTRLS